MLEKVFKEGRSSFVAVYGRRHIGKTELIRHVLGEQTVFNMTGIANFTTATSYHFFDVKCQARETKCKKTALRLIVF